MAPIPVPSHPDTASKSIDTATLILFRDGLAIVWGIDCRDKETGRANVLSTPFSFHTSLLSVLLLTEIFCPEM